MSDAFIAWYRTRTDKNCFEGLERVFAESGISLEHPNLGSPVLLDADGNQVPMPAGRVAELVGLALGALNVEWWFDADTDLTCQFSYEPLGWEKQTYYLDGLTDQQAKTVEETLVRQALANPPDTVALVVDRSGRTVEFDWDAVASGYSTGVDRLPDILVLEASVARETPGFPAGTRLEEFGPGLELVVGADYRPGGDARA